MYLNVGKITCFDYLPTKHGEYFIIHDILQYMKQEIYPRTAHISEDIINHICVDRPCKTRNNRFHIFNHFGFIFFLSAVFGSESTDRPMETTSSGVGWVDSACSEIDSKPSRDITSS